MPRSPLPRLIAAVLVPLGLIVLLGACAGAPRALAPVPGMIPQDPALYPQDAVFAAHAVLGRIQDAPPQGAGYAIEAAAALDRQPFRYPGFSIAEHRLIRYGAPDQQPQSRTTMGSLLLGDRHGRMAGLFYTTSYHLSENALVLDTASAAPLYRTGATVRAFLVPRNLLPALGDTWEATFTTMARQDDMPEGGLRTTHLLGTHALVLFVMERMHPDTELVLDFPIPDVNVALPAVEVGPESYRDYDGWRVAVITISPGMQARR